MLDRSSRHARARTQVGAAAVEFALLLPIMMLVIGGITDFGRALFTQIQLTNAAREGARAAIVGADGEARAAAASGGLDNFSADVPACSGPGAAVIATTRVTGFDWMVLEPIMNVVPGPAPVLPDVLESEAVMRCN